MGLLCGEHRDTPDVHFLTTSDQVYCVTTKASPHFTTACQQVIDAIPAEERLREPCETGVDIHWAFSVPNVFPGPGEQLSLTGLELGNWRFSISAETAKRYLPGISWRYLADDD